MTQVAIQLTDELNKFVETSVKAGVFHNASEMVANALHALKSRDEAKLSALRSDLALGLEQAGRGELAEFDAESVITKMRRSSS